MCGVTPAAITLAAQNGIIGITEDGFVNLDHKKTKAYLKKKREKAAEKGLAVEPPPRKVRSLRQPEIPPLKKREPEKPKEPPKAKKKKAKKKTEKKTASNIVNFPGRHKPPAPPPVVRPPPPPPPTEFRSLADLSEMDLQLMSKQDIDKMKVIEQTLKTRLDREHAEGLLVKRMDVKRVFAKIYSVDVNELKAMEDRLTPAICGVFGEADDSDHAVEIRKMLNNEITKSLRHIKRLLNDYLVGAKAEVI